jgi:hypothetical protein
MRQLRSIEPKSSKSFGTPMTADAEMGIPRFRHTWSKEVGGMLDSTCQRCSTLVARNRNEITLLFEEQKHSCRGSKPTRRAVHD